MDARSFQNRLYDAARELIPREAPVVCAVSGGVDSMALLYGLHAVNGNRGCGWLLHVAHLDHGLRDESAADAAFGRKAAAALGLECTARRIDVASAAQAAGETVEQAGRRARYGFLEDVAAAIGASVVATGHQADDQVETVLHHIARGTGLRGLAGMPRRRPIREGSDIELVRPLLGFRRAELLAYLEGHGHAYRLDPTNDDATAATRNMIRHQVLPLLESSVNPEVGAAVLRLSRQARRADEAIRFFAAEALNGAQVHRGRDEIILSTESLATLPEAIRTEVVLMVLRRLGVSLQAVGSERIEAAAEAACGGGERRLVELPGGVTVERRGAELRFRAGVGSRRTPPRAVKNAQ
ncbi:MAG: tRNA lysidine(34) synthetase TilS [Phycisphaerae bacterium]|nr:tRNA lysidine(34) synthetase TilS [Phycisphaerae bacterium]